MICGVIFYATLSFSVVLLHTKKEDIWWNLNIQTTEPNPFVVRNVRNSCRRCSLFPGFSALVVRLSTEIYELYLRMMRENESHNYGSLWKKWAESLRFVSRLWRISRAISGWTWSGGLLFLSVSLFFKVFFVVVEHAYKWWRNMVLWTWWVMASDWQAFLSSSERAIADISEQPGIGSSS